MFQSPSTVCRAWFDGRRPTDASCCRVRDLILVPVTYKACMHACCPLALLHSLQLLTMVMGTCAFCMQLLHSMPASCKVDAEIQNA